MSTAEDTIQRRLVVVATGPQALLQDEGRPGLGAVGVGRTGAADRAAYRLGHRLLGNRPGAASIEALLGGLSVRIHGPVELALTGAPAPATALHEASGRRYQIGYGAPATFDDGTVLSLAAPPAGLRSYLAVRGGFAVPPVLESRSTDVLAGLGPPPLAAGDELPIGPAEADYPGVDVAPYRAPVPGDQPVVLRVLPGPRRDWFADPAALGHTAWQVSPKSNRVGVRLTGTPLVRVPERAQDEVPSEGMVRGAIQVPPSGEPVVFLNDHPVTGGYPVIGVVASKDVDLAAQAQPGQEMRFRWT